MSIQSLAKKYGYLDYMIKRYQDMFDEKELIEFLEANDKPLPASFRVNTLDNDAEKHVINRLKNKRFKLKKIENIDSAYQVLSQKFSIGSTTEYLLGYLYIQRLSSMLPSLILNPNSHDLVLDMCAAPGGKTNHLSNLMNNYGNIIALDDDKNRINSLISNLRRCRTRNVTILLKDAKNLRNLNKSFDKILLDAPCTGEGLIMHDPSRKMSRTIKDIQIMSKIQKNLLREGLKYLKINGILVYSTCSIAPEENELVINDVLNEFHVKIEEIRIPFGSSGYVNIFNKKLNSSLINAIRLYPHKDKMEGFFICKLRKIKEN